MGVRGGSGELSRSPCTSRRLSAGSRPSGNAMTAGRAAPARRGNPHCLSHVRQSHAQRKMRFPRAEKAFSTRKIKHFFYFSGHTLLIICILRLKRGFTCGGSPLILALCVCSDGVPAQAGTGLRRPTGLRPLLIYIRTRVRAKADTGGTGGRETGEAGGSQQPTGSTRAARYACGLGAAAVSAGCLLSSGMGSEPLSCVTS